VPRQNSELSRNELVSHNVLLTRWDAKMRHDPPVESFSDVVCWALSVSARSSPGKSGTPPVTPDDSTKAAASAASRIRGSALSPFDEEASREFTQHVLELRIEIQFSPRLNLGEEPPRF